MLARLDRELSPEERIHLSQLVINEIAASSQRASPPQSQAQAYASPARQDYSDQSDMDESYSSTDDVGTFSIVRRNLTGP